jgi:hypothetical protein
VKPDTTKQLIALHAQCSAMVQLLEALIDSEDSGICRHEHAVDVGTMGTPPGSRMHCNDCGEYFSRIEEQP